MTEPSRPLGEHGKKLWDSIQAEYGIEDAGGVAMLMEVCKALDRLVALEKKIDRNVKSVEVKEETALRTFMVRTLRQMGLEVEPIKAVGRPNKFLTVGVRDAD